MADAEYRITTHDASVFTDDEIAMDAAVFNSFEQEVWPEDPVTSRDDAIAAHRAVPARVRRTSFRAWAPDGTLAGSVELSVDPEDDDNPDLLGCHIYVRPDHRRRGIGGALLAHVVDAARRESRHTLFGETFSPIPAGDAFAQAIGAEAKASSHSNHLPTAEVDRALMEAWVRAGPERAPGYELVAWDGAIPGEHLDAFVDLLLVMNDAPRDELEVNDFTLTPAEWREIEEQSAAIGHETWTLVARRVSDGALAGVHDVVWTAAFPQAVYIGRTGVRADHRGHALGKWLKAAMTLRVLDERPGVTDIRTDNADSNEAMLGINREMGYRPLFANTTWQLAVEQAASWLEERRGQPAGGRG